MRRLRVIVNLAFQCYRAAAEHGNATGQYNLATFYYLGWATAPDAVAAAKWFRAAADQGLAKAQANLALFYFKGTGVPIVAAYLWYSRAVAAGDNSGASHLKSVAHHLSRQQLQQANSQLAADASRSRPPEATAASGDITLFEHP